MTRSGTVGTPTLDRFRLDGKVAMVTGVGPTNGKCFALALAEAGADVCLVARSATIIDETADLIERMGRRALPVQADMNDPDAIDATVAKVQSELGEIDILCNHSGTGVPMSLLKVSRVPRRLRRSST